MALKDYLTGTTNKILIGAATAVGLIITGVAGVSVFTPAYQVRDSGGQVKWQVNLAGQSTQSGVIASKTLANCNTIDGTSTGMLVCGTDDGGSSGGGGAWSGTGALQTYFDPRYVNTSGDTMTGKLLINLTTGTDALEVVQTASASKLHANTLLTVSGSVVVEDNVTVDGLMSFVGYSASPQLTATDTTSGLHFDGPGIVSLHNGGTQTMLLSSTNRVGIGIGSPETKLEVEGTVSGTTLYGLQSVQSSGSLIVEGLTTLHGSIEMDGGNINDLGNVTFKTGAAGGVLQTGTSAADKFVLNGYDVNDGVYRNVFEVDAGNTVLFEFNEDGNDIDFRAEGDTDQNLLFLDASTDRAGIGTSAPQFKFDVSGTAHATNLFSSGALTWEGAGSGATLYLGGQFEGVGLTDCDAATQTIAWDATTKRFSCGTDSDTTYTAGQGLTLTSTSFRLTAAHSGSVITATTTLASSGTLVVEGAMSGASLVASTSFRGSGLTDCDTAGTSKLLWDTTTGRFSCGTDTDTNTTYTAGQGLTLSSTSFRTNATLSGVTIWATTALRSSGSLVVEGTASGSTFIGNTISGATLRGRYISPRYLSTEVFASGSTIVTGSGKVMLTIPDTMSGYKLETAHLSVGAAGTTNTTAVQIRNLAKNARKMLGTVLSIDSAETGSDTAATPAVITAASADVGAYDRLMIDVSSVSTTPPKSPMVLVLKFYKP